VLFNRGEEKEEGEKANKEYEHTAKRHWGGSSHLIDESAKTQSFASGGAKKGISTLAEKKGKFPGL